MMDHFFLFCSLPPLIVSRAHTNSRIQYTVTKALSLVEANEIIMKLYLLVDVSLY